MDPCEDRQVTSQPSLRPNSNVGQLSFSPATQTTVVTTTTTTTTSFPPFVLNAPKHLLDRDPEMYPLASICTPGWLKKLKFPLGGQEAQFEEAENAEQSLTQYRRQQDALRANDGMLRYSNSSGHARRQGSHPGERFARPLKPHTNRQTHELESLRNQSVTPISMSDEGASDPDAAELDSFHLPHNYRPPVEGSHPIRPVLQPSPRLVSTCPAVSPIIPAGRRPQREMHERPNRNHERQMVGSTTPPHQTSGNDSPECSEASFVGPRALGSIDTSSVQNASLPSPSLSPITAAAQMGRTLPGSRLRGGVTSGAEASEYFVASSKDRIQGEQRDAAANNGSIATPTSQSGELSPPSITDIPRLLDTFDSMPDSLQTYVMYQLLRRCPKKTLHFVSDAVEPALKVDFLKRLPAELRQQIVFYLDVQSMCRAAQVSKQWRQIIDRDESAWKELIRSDGLKVPQGEVERAVREGWGWQYPRHGTDWETDLTRRQSNFEGLGISSQLDHDFAEATSLKRKRRDTKSGPSTKKLKRRETENSFMTDLIAQGHGPNAYAKLAESSVPDPKIGLRGLRQLALHKAIYRRHYMMRRSWLKPDSQPKHIAFRAHEGHVITCLQFDNDKILTGSGDAIIDIYDTATGAQRRRLTGHEGGVWALEYQDNILVSGSTDRSVRIWDMDAGKCLHVFQGHTSTVRCLQIIQPVQVGVKSDGKPEMLPAQPLIITGSRDSSCRIWKLPKMGERSVMQTNSHATDGNQYFVRALTGHAHSVRAIAAHSDVLVSGSYDNTVKVWSIESGENTFTLRGHSTKVYSVVLDHERRRCISGSMDTIVKVWSVDTGECLFNLNGHNSLVGLPDLRDNVLVSAAADWTLKIWNPDDGRNLHTLKAHNSAITCFAHDGYKVVSGSEKALKMWNTQTGECVRDLLTDLRGVWQVRFDERRCIAAVHRGDWTYIEVLDFGAAADGVPRQDRGRRIVVDAGGKERRIEEDEAELEDGVEQGPQVVEVND